MEDKLQALHELYFSQSALGIFQSCPLRFRRRYVDGLYWPKVGGDRGTEEKMERGRLFHLLAQRYFLGLAPGKEIDPSERELKVWLEALNREVPIQEGWAYLPEHELRLRRDRLGLVAKYDLVVIKPDGRVTIYDWKTDKKAPNRTYLKRHLQTIVYLYLLCAAGGTYSPRGNFLPGEVDMVYWNPQFPQKRVSLTYTQGELERDGAMLGDLVDRIMQTPYHGYYPTSEERICAACEYSPLCHDRRGMEFDWAEDEMEMEAGLSWDAVPEIPY